MQRGDTRDDDLSYMDEDGGSAIIDDTTIDDIDNPQRVYGADPNYNQPVYRAALARSDYRDKLIAIINTTSLFMETKTGLKTLVRGLFDKVAVLAKTDNLFLEEIDAKIALQEARLGYSPFDVNNPQLANLENTILIHYRQYISRSDRGWERGLQNKIETSHTQHLIQQNPMNTGEPTKKRGFWRRLTP